MYFFIKNVCNPAPLLTRTHINVKIRIPINFKAIYSIQNFIIINKDSIINKNTNQ